ncbi:MAG TPA: hypothetical protein DCL42_00925 [Deltaproteobacteria bacterium]|nr:hypothetical protein [Deltaproteobacteria bacterium]
MIRKTLGITHGFVQAISTDKNFHRGLRKGKSNLPMTRKSLMPRRKRLTITVSLNNLMKRKKRNYLKRDNGGFSHGRT